MTLAAALAIAKAPPRFDTSTDEQVAAFLRHLMPWAARRGGCPLPPEAPKHAAAGVISQVTCWPATAYVDNDEWRQARELAKVVFRLRD